jgi:ABC-2 type transport system permease protein
MLRLFFKFISIALRSQMQYKTSFLVLTATHFFSIFTEIIGVWVLFDRFKIVQGWTFHELALIYGIVHVGFAFAEAFARSFEKFPPIIRNGEFDRLLLRPLSTIFQVSMRDIQIFRIGRLLQGVIVLTFGCLKLHLSIFSLVAPVILISIAGVTALFYGLFIIQGSIVFWTIENFELINITTYGSREISQYPMSLYHTGFKLFFTLVIPLACAAYYPIATLLCHESLPLKIVLIAPFSGFVFLYLARQFWKIGLRQYHSTGS